MIKSGTTLFAESVSDQPVAKPLHLRIPSQSERILAYVRYEQHRAAQEREIETFEEADDFSLDDGEEWFSPHEIVFEPDETPAIAESAPPVATATQTAPPAPVPPESQANQ